MVLEGVQEAAAMEEALEAASRAGLSLGLGSPASPKPAPGRTSRTMHEKRAMSPLQM